MAESIFFLICILFFCAATEAVTNETRVNDTYRIHIGAVLDVNSTQDFMAHECMKMGLSDFYHKHQNYTTRLKLHITDSQSLRDADFEVLEQLNHDPVNGTRGTPEEAENKIITELGEKVLVPIISFTARNSNTSFSNNRYFVKATPDDFQQAKALAAICQKYEWPEVAVLHEETNHGRQFLSHLTKALQEVEIGLAYTISVPTSIQDDHLLKEMRRVKVRQTRVFLVHMNPSLGYRFFALAERVGLMSEGYGWIVSSSLSNFMNDMDRSTRHSMQGILGVRPYLYHSKELVKIQKRWKRRMILATRSVSELNVYGLWAYDAVTALAMAAEKISLVNSTSANITNNSSNLRNSLVGFRLVKELAGIQFKGLTGDFQLNGNNLEQSAFEIFNVCGSGDKIVGFWTPGKGILRELNSTAKQMKNVIWPGDCITKPKGWDIPITERLGAALPLKPGFTNGKLNGRNSFETNHTGFGIDVFIATVKVLPFPVNRISVSH